MSRYDNVKLIKSILFNTEGMDDATYDRLCKTIDLEEVPQEDLWKDGELTQEQLETKILDGIDDGDYLLMRECYACATQRHACEHDNYKDTSIHISEPIKQIMDHIDQSDFGPRKEEGE